MASDLVGLAIGRDGNNVNEVRKLDGILTVEFEDYNQMFRVRAKVGEPMCALYMYMCLCACTNVHVVIRACTCTCTNISTCTCVYAHVQMCM